MHSIKYKERYDMIGKDKKEKMTSRDCKRYIIHVAQDVGKHDATWNHTFNIMNQEGKFVVTKKSLADYVGYTLKESGGIQ